jgi:hypothetical protein
MEKKNWEVKLQVDGVDRDWVVRLLSVIGAVIKVTYPEVNFGGGFDEAKEDEDVSPTRPE